MVVLVNRFPQREHWTTYLGPVTPPIDLRVEKPLIPFPKGEDVLLRVCNGA